jgi:diguanylate cyclase (GGDEF)-like protein
MTAFEPTLPSDGPQQLESGSAEGGASCSRPVAQPGPSEQAIPATCAAALAMLPGVVLYQRIVRPDGEIRYTYISEGAYELFGVPADEIISNPHALFGCHANEYRSKFRERLLAASKTLTTWDVEASIVARDGAKKYTHAIARPDRLADGSVLWTGVILDETRTRTAIIENLSQGLLLYDADDRLILRNTHFLRLYPSLLDSVVPGVTYEDVVRMELASSASIPRDEAELSPEFHRCMDRHSDPDVMYERELGNDRWVLVNEHRTGDGGTVVLYTDISELKRRDRELQHLAYHDAMTGLPNRELFQQRVDQALANAKRNDLTVAVLCLDLDYFKNVNDTLGHPAGDALLKCVAERLRSCFRDVDTVARVGGDEFAIVLANLNKPDAASTLASRLLQVVSHPMDFNGQQIITGLSIGIAIAPSDGDDTAKLIKNADLALYRAKADGRGTFRFFEAEMDARAQARRILEIGLRQSISKNELEVHYQPQVDIFTNEIGAFEALVRWRHPEKGLIPPSDFIPLAEETGIIIRLGEWVLRRACQDALSWPPSIRVSVNVSPAQFRNQNLTQMVMDVVKETGIDPRRIELEITESILLRDVEANLKTLRDLKRFGIRISMDDFGTGYSSLGNLRSFPFDNIKIDRSFVSDLEENADSAAIVHAVIGLGHSLGMATCAEGVETMEQLAYLRSEGCSKVQGYLYSKPKPAAEIARMIEQGFGKPARLALEGVEIGTVAPPVAPQLLTETG